MKEKKKKREQQAKLHFKAGNKWLFPVLCCVCQLWWGQTGRGGFTWDRIPTQVQEKLVRFCHLLYAEKNLIFAGGFLGPAAWRDGLDCEVFNKSSLGIWSWWQGGPAGPERGDEFGKAEPKGSWGCSRDQHLQLELGLE